ncbi:NAD(P)/FAD-dependent oxidoreductase [Microbacteriaceae bacterium VKM Ac-2854]|nr:NAD(P)/FAD-dependent oxidoreductase [Microbacteriaceae bacterium VKM Ac-2854]
MTTTPAREFDVIVIGAGPVGENVADRVVQGGLTAVIVEWELVGGECSYWACMPSKALLRAPMAVRAAQALPGAAEAVTGSVDAQALFRYRNGVTSQWQDDGQLDWLDSAGIELVRGHGRITAPREVTVTDADGSVTLLSARRAVVVATGTTATIPDITGMDEAEPWTSRDATSAQRVPRSMIIIGGGVVACEMATVYASLGSEVTLLSRSALLKGLEPFVGEMVQESLEKLGVKVHTDARPIWVQREETEEVSVTLSDETTIEAMELLVATGRSPHTKDLGLDAIGLEPGAWLDVDDTMRVVDAGGHLFDDGWLYAVGDVNHRVLLTHQGKYQARAAGDVIVARAKGEPVQDAPWGAHVATADHESVPQVVFTDPEVAAAGLTAAAAEKAGYRIRVVDYDIGHVAGATLVAQGYTGKARMVVDEDRQVVLGVTFVGAEVGELIHSATVAITGQVPLSRLWHAVPSYPTISEVWLRLLETYGRQSA